MSWQASVKGRSARPRKGFTATKCWSGQSGAMREQAARAASRRRAASPGLAWVSDEVIVFIGCGGLRGWFSAEAGEEPVGVAAEVEAPGGVDVEGLPEPRAGPGGELGLEDEQGEEEERDERHHAQFPRGAGRRVVRQRGGEEPFKDRVQGEVAERGERGEGEARADEAPPVRGGPEVPQEIGDGHGEDAAEEEGSVVDREAEEAADAPGDANRREQDGGEDAGVRGGAARGRPGGLAHLHDAARGEEGVGLVERVGNDVEDGEGEGAKAALQHHEAHLRDGRVGERALHAGLGEHDGGGKDGGEGADDREDIERGGREDDERAEPHDEEAAGIDDPGVHERGDRRGGFHRLGQPGVEGELRRLQDRAEDEEDADCSAEAGWTPPAPGDSARAKS